MKTVVTRASLNSAAVVTLACLSVSFVLIFYVAPTESTMGDVQRILYLHVPIAWCGLVCCIAMAFCGAAYLRSRKLEWDHWSKAVAELGWISTTLTLLTGSAWAHEAWGVWWTWDPRLTTSLVLWLIYAGVLLTRGAIDDPLQRARICAVLAIVGMGDVPLVIMATRWFRGVHPIAPEMDPQMRWVLLACVTIYTALFVHLTFQRKRQLAICEQLEQLDADLTSSYTS